MRDKGVSDADQGFARRAGNIRSVGARAIANGEGYRAARGTGSAGCRKEDEPQPDWLRPKSEVSGSCDCSQGRHMTDATLPAGRFSDGDFRVGHVVDQAWSVLSRNFPRFFLVMAV